jgi:hypothetical protein
MQSAAALAAECSPDHIRTVCGTTTGNWLPPLSPQLGAGERTSKAGTPLRRERRPERANRATPVVSARVTWGSPTGPSRVQRGSAPVAAVDDASGRSRCDNPGCGGGGTDHPDGARSPSRGRHPSSAAIGAAGSRRRSHAPVLHRHVYRPAWTPPGRRGNERTCDDYGSACSFPPGARNGCDDFSSIRGCDFDTQDNSAAGGFRRPFPRVRPVFW